MIYLYIGIPLLLIFLGGMGWYISSKVFTPNAWPFQKTYDFELEKGNFDLEYFKKFVFEDVEIKNDGLKLYGQMINNKSDKTIILMHGHTFTLVGSYKYIKIFLDLGFNVLMPDQRYHGHSEGSVSTLGYRESTDLEKWTDFILEKIPSTKTLGYHGESMGAATVLLNGHNKNIDFIISDCGFSSLKRQTMDILWRRHKIPPIFVYPAHVMGSIIYKVPLLKVKPKDNVKNINVPILFIHGDSDTYIGLDHMERLVKGANDKETYICPGADHAACLVTDFDKYKEVVVNFLKGRKII